MSVFEFLSNILLGIAGSFAASFFYSAFSTRLERRLNIYDWYAVRPRYVPPPKLLRFWHDGRLPLEARLAENINALITRNRLSGDREFTIGQDDSLVTETLTWATIVADNAVFQSRWNRTYILLAEAGGALGLAIGIYYAFTNLQFSDLNFFITVAHAQGIHRLDLATLGPILLCCILGLMGLAFLASIFVALTTPTIPGTLGKRRTADNIIKMSGSFLVGFGMALLK